MFVMNISNTHVSSLSMFVMDISNTHVSHGE
jgi:hypothetical protein